MKKNKIIIIIIIFLLLIACTEKEKLKVHYISHEKEIAFPLDSTKEGKPLDFQYTYVDFFDYCDIDDIETIIVPINKNRLAFYDIKTKNEYHSIPLLDNRNIINFNFINKDSIFVFYDIQYSDSTLSKLEPLYLQLLNYAGESKIYDLDSGINTVFNIRYDVPNIIINNNIFFPTQITKINNSVINNSLETPEPIFAYYDTKKDKFNFSKTIRFPKVEENVYYNTHFNEINCCLSERKLPVIHFFYSSLLYEWNYTNDEVIYHTIKSKIIDTIFPLKSANTSPESLSAVYNRFYYDNNNKTYYSFLVLNKDLYGNYNNLLILADENFKYIGEILNPEIGGFVKFYKNYLVSYQYSNDSIRIYYDKLAKTNRPLQPYLDSVNDILTKQKNSRLLNSEPFNKKINDLLKSKYPKLEKDYVLLTMYAGSGCPPCGDNIKMFINRNYEVLQKLPFYFIYSGISPEVIEIENYKGIMKIKTIKDSLGIMKNIVLNENKYNELNPRLTVIKNNKIEFDTIYSYLDMEKLLIPTLLDKLELISEKKK
ncbi:MAG: hypothetical protein LBV69_02220 [Bacteroidales bacterium]|jgi:hypothetical protein|nr:hypothetical protein [Bacteroidales bacterium]